MLILSVLGAFLLVTLAFLYFGEGFEANLPRWTALLAGFGAAMMVAGRGGF